MSSPTPTGPLQNVYYKRPVGTPKPCNICYRETRTVLWNPQDFLYTCDSHLTDPGFATSVEPDPLSTKVTLGEEELKKIKDEWEERQKKKKEQEEAEKEKKDKASTTSTAASWLGWATGGSNDASGSSTPSSSTPSKKAQLPSLFSAPGAAPSHQKFVLHRQIFAIREREFRKKRQTSQANAIAPRLPIVPRHLG